MGLLAIKHDFAEFKLEALLKQCNKNILNECILEKEIVFMGYVSMNYLTLYLIITEDAIYNMLRIFFLSQLCVLV